MGSEKPLKKRKGTLKKFFKKRKTSGFTYTEWRKAVILPLRDIYLGSIIVDLFLLCLYQPQGEFTRARYFEMHLLLPLGIALAVLVALVVFLRHSVGKLRPGAINVVVIILVNLFAAVYFCAHKDVALMSVVGFLPLVLIPTYHDQRFIAVQTVICVVVFSIRQFLFPEPVVTISTESAIVQFIFLLILLYTFVRLEMGVMVVTNALDMLGSKDSLTHLLNHEAFYEALDAQMADYAESKTPFSVIISDIDNFKKVNDTYGHAFGDDVLRRLSEVYVECQGTHDVCARYGGEEFAVVMPHKNRSEAIQQAEQIRKAFEASEFRTEDGGTHSFTISLGVAEYTHPYETASAFFEMADKALYEAKGAGKNRVCAYKE